MSLAEKNNLIPYATPESQGVPSAALLEYIDFLDKQHDLHAVTIARHGKVIANAVWRPYRDDMPHQLFSLSKSFVSVAIGFACSEGLLTLNDRVVDIFPELRQDAEEANMESLTVRNLLTMASGLASCPLDSFIKNPDPEHTFLQRFFKHPRKWTPGEYFNYNSANTYFCAEIIRRVSGQDVVDYLTPRLYEPLGIPKPDWQRDPWGGPLGGWGQYLSIDSITRFNLMLAAGGKWQGKQVVPAEYLKEATSTQIDNSHNWGKDWVDGYGYQFWQCSYPGAYRGDGAFGQYALVVPDKGITVSVTSGMACMAYVMTRLWEQLLPALSDEPLPVNVAVAEALSQKLASLEMPRPQGEILRPMWENGCWSIEDTVCGFKAMSLSFNAGGGEMVFYDGDGNGQRAPFGFGKWLEGNGLICGDNRGPVAATAAFSDEKTLNIALYCLSEPQRIDYCITKNDDGSIQVKRDFSLWFCRSEDEQHCTFDGTPMEG